MQPMDYSGPYSVGVFFVIRGNELKRKFTEHPPELADWRTMCEKSQKKLFLTVEEIKGSCDSMMLTPASRLSPGLYSVNLEKDEYTFLVEIKSLKDYWIDVLTERPDHWQGHNHLGSLIYMEARSQDGEARSQKMKEAQKHFRRAADLNPNNPEVHHNLGLTLTFFGQYKEALPEYHRAVEINGTVPAIRQSLADCLSILKQYEPAVTEYIKVLEMDPRNTNAHLGYGYVLSQIGRLPKAKEQFEAVLRMDPNNAIARRNLDAVKKLLGGK